MKFLHISQALLNTSLIRGFYFHRWILLRLIFLTSVNKVIWTQRKQADGKIKTSAWTLQFSLANLKTFPSSFNHLQQEASNLWKHVCSLIFHSHSNILPLQNVSVIPAEQSTLGQAPQWPSNLDHFQSCVQTLLCIQQPHTWNKCSNLLMEMSARSLGFKK